MKNVLVTGGAGFAGSHFIRHVLEHQNSLATLVNLDLLTYAGNLDNLRDVQGDSRYSFVQGDVRDRELVRSLFHEYDFDTVVHFAAESSVDRSVDEPERFLSTNVLGTQSLLDAAKVHWSMDTLGQHPSSYKPGVRFIQISTDEVYGELGEGSFATEMTPLNPTNPYSASKASADLMVHAYHEKFGLPVNIIRGSNFYGPYQSTDKLIPLVIREALEGKAVPVYGDGMQIRDWLHVHDHCTAILAVLENGRDGEVYNVGGNNETPCIEIVRYANDSTKANIELGWKPVYTVKQGVLETVRWYLSYGKISAQD